MTAPLRVGYAGTPVFAVAALRAIAEAYEVCAVFTQPDRPAGRGKKPTASPVKQAGLELGIPIYQPQTLRDPAAVEQLAQLHIDVLVVAAYGLILPASVLTIPKFGCINIHASLLPRWRGAAPIQRAILAGDEKTGISIMGMAEGLDTGDVYKEYECLIGPSDTSGQLHDRLMDMGAQGIVEVLGEIGDGSAQSKPQQNELATYAQKIEKSESWIDWSQPAVQIDRVIRAFNPWPKARTQLAEKTLHLLSAQVEECAVNEAPGVVLAAKKDRISVATGAGVLHILEVQLPGRRIQSVESFLNANKVAQGEQLKPCL